MKSHILAIRRHTELPLDASFECITSRTVCERHRSAIQFAYKIYFGETMLRFMVTIFEYKSKPGEEIRVNRIVGDIWDWINPDRWSK